MSQSVWLVGAGIMSQAYAPVLQSQNVDLTVIGRGQTSAAAFTEATGVSVVTGGLDSWLTKVPQKPDAAIVAVNVEQLAPTTLQLMEYGIKHILLEKPAGLNPSEIKALHQKAEYYGASIYVAYNRRFYAATLKAQELIQADGGVTSFCFEFTEWGHVIEALENPPEVKKQWFLANSSHVVDLAFFLGGHPEQIHCQTAGSLHWHPAASVFTGSGTTNSGALFSYHANWAAPGRWGVEVLTAKHRFYFRPMEILQIQEIASVQVSPVDIDDSLDKEFKPGIYRQTEAFLKNELDTGLCSLAEHVTMLPVYENMVTPNR